MSLGDWNEVARATGLTVAHVVPELVTGTTFHSLRREMAHATSSAPSYATSPWLHGARRDVAVIVHVSPMRQVGEPPPRAPTHTSNVVLDEHEIVVARGGFASPREISRRLQSLVGIVDRMTPAAPSAGPFR